MCWYVQNNETMDFLHKMSKDPKLLAQYRDDPRAAVENSGLSRNAKDALLSSDKNDLFRALFSHDTLSHED